MSYKPRELRPIDVSSKMEALWHPSHYSPGSPAVDITLPYNCFFTNNTFDPDVDGVRKVEAGFLWVNPYYRGSGIGEALVKGLGALAKSYDYHELFVCIASQYSLDIFGRVFDRERIKFYDLNRDFYDLRGINARTPMYELEGLNFDNVRSVLVGLEDYEGDIEHRNMGFPITVDMEGLDVSNWPVALERGRDRIDLSMLETGSQDE